MRNKCPYCGKYVKKGNKFCNKSHAASFNNSKFVKRKRIAWHPCLSCGKDTRNEKYCTLQCQADFAWKAKKRKIESGTYTAITNKTLKKYLIEARGHICEICGLSKWLDKAIPLVLDHINGNPYDNKLNNIRLVCGNCDMQLPTYKGKNAGKGRFYRRKRYSEGKSY